MTDSPNAYAPNPYAQSPNPYAPTRPPRPPLTPRARTGALIAGGVAMLMVSIGGAMVAIPLLLLLVGAIVTTIANSVGGDALEVLAGIERFLPTGVLIGVSIALVVLGAALVVAALFISRGILRGRGLGRAWPITWAGLGIAVVASWVVSGVLSIPLQLASSGLNAWGGSGEIEGGLALIGVAGNAVVTAAVGAFAWWWMAHAMRPAA